MPVEFQPLKSACCERQLATASVRHAQFYRPAASQRILALQDAGLRVGNVTNATEGSDLQVLVAPNPIESCDGQRDCGFAKSHAGAKGDIRRGDQSTGEVNDSR